jgi:UDP-N-acetylglucosamine--N-acetylmuramyl-(pentapeptide) pyrophosphoryl-undecaprenol N-acetylglucosamine transferase
MIRVVISGGGTGGHVFPAIAIANAIRKSVPDADILFIGAKGKLEMDKVPAAGYRIEGLTISGFQRRLTWKNLSFPFKVIGSLMRADQLIRQFKPDVVIGVGGYASGPTLRVAARKKIPTLIQEQNSYPGVTNKLLGSKVSAICVAYSGMEKFFPKEKIILTGNPVRQDIELNSAKRSEAMIHFGLDSKKKTLLVLGGSLGARTINESIGNCIRQAVTGQGLQIIWQTGKYYFEAINSDQIYASDKAVKIFPFIEKMDLAYNAADMIISRAGAIAISELCIIGKPVILIPSPNVAEDHQTKNARALADRNAAILVPDNQAMEALPQVLLSLLEDEEKQRTLSQSIRSLAISDAANRIADEALALAGGKKD